MHSRALALVLAIVMAWMGFSAQEQIAEICSETLSEQAQTAPAPASGSLLDEHHLDDLPFQLLADLLGLLGPSEAAATAGLTVRPQVLPPRGWLAPHLDGLHRPPIALA